MVVDNRLSIANEQHVLKVTCRECGTDICGMCKNEYHPNVQSCAEFAQIKKKQEEDSHRKNEELNKQYFAENMVKNCPNCKIAIQKVCKNIIFMCLPTIFVFR